jgi:uncharacterized membrane protein YfcA
MLMFVIGLLLVGLLVGGVSGMLGIGGGVLVIPALTLLFGFSQKQAVGTSLAMLLPPIGIFAFLTYYRAGNIDLRAAALLAVSFAAGAWLGSIGVNKGWVSDAALRRLFAFFLLYVAGRILFQEPKARAAAATVGLMLGYAGTYAAAGLLARRWEHAPAAHTIYQQKVQRPAAHDFEI